MIIPQHREKEFGNTMTQEVKAQKVYLETYGCQMNILDSEMLKSHLDRQGYAITHDKREADFIFMNTCTVREHAEDRVYSRMGSYRFLQNRKPHLVFGILGCLAQKDSSALSQRLPHVKIICGTHAYARLGELMEQARQGKLAVDTQERQDEVTIFERETLYRESPYSTYVLAMKGCDCSCTFCIVPRVRGPEVSRTPEEVASEVRRLVQQGVQEVILTGQNITSYGKGLRPRRQLADLLYEVSKVPGLKRLKFITSHPAFANDQLFEAMRDLPVVAPYLHIPAQSGSNRILKKMRRGYTRERYLEIVSRVRSYVPRVGVASDFIVGFPGETDQDFEETLDLIQKACFVNAFLFKYSRRPGTPAAQDEDQVPENVKKERHQILLTAQRRISLRLNEKMIGETIPVLMEGQSKRNPHRFMGRAPDHRTVLVESDQPVEGKLLPVCITQATSVALYGRVVDNLPETSEPL